jgi:peptidyl-tRNA hydrolase
MVEYVQALVAARAGSHEEVVVATARASVLAWVTAPLEPGWEPWISGRFVKSVRRARPAEFLRICEQAIWVENEGQARVAAFPPIPLEEWWEPLRKLQVGHFERDRTGVWPNREGGPQLLINPDIEMSTGKTAAQVSHGVFAYAKGLSPATRAMWVGRGLPFAVAEKVADWSALVEACPLIIRDAGRTEIEPDTVTILVFPAG